MKKKLNIDKILNKVRKGSKYNAAIDRLESIENGENETANNLIQLMKKKIDGNNKELVDIEDQRNQIKEKLTNDLKDIMTDFVDGYHSRILMINTTRNMRTFCAEGVFKDNNMKINNNFKKLVETLDSKVTGLRKLIRESKSKATSLSMQITESSDKISDLEKRKKDLPGEIEQAKSEVKRLTKERDFARNAAEAAQKEIEDIEKQLKIQKEIQGTRKQIDDLTRQLPYAEKEFIKSQKEEEAIKGLINAIQEHPTLAGAFRSMEKIAKHNQEMMQ